MRKTLSQIRRSLKPVKTASFSTGTYKFQETGRILGSCEQPDVLWGRTYRSPMLIEVEQSLTGLKLLDTTIHESFHAEFPVDMWHYITENKTEAFGTNLARFLWRLGYRRVGVDI